jgi:regulator of cell morphogenesis and NO signaling
MILGGSMTIHPTTTVGDLAVAYPSATRVFETLGIDYCCGGKRTLEEACRLANLPLETVVGSLARAEELASAKPSTDGWQNATLASLTTHIVETHHLFTRNELQRIEALLAKVCAVHGANHPELLKVQTLFQNLKEDLFPHMLKEEQILFPYIEQLENALAHQEGIARPFFGTVQNPVRMMMYEHDAAGEILRQVREVTNQYTVPQEGCISYQTLYQALQNLEADLHQHIHLENNLLFPRAIAFENQLQTTAQSASVAGQNNAVL